LSARGRVERVNQRERQMPWLLLKKRK